MEKKDESYLDNLLQEFSKEPPNTEDRRSTGNRRNKTNRNLMLDSLESEFELEDIDEILLDDFELEETVVKEEAVVKEEEASSIEDEEPSTENEPFEEEVLELPEDMISEDDFQGFEKEAVEEKPLVEASETEASGDLMGSEIGTEELFSDVGGLEELEKLGLNFDQMKEEEEFSSAEEFEEEKVDPKADTSTKKKKGGIFGFFGKLFSNVPLSEDELKAIPTPEEEMEAKKAKQDEAKLKKEEKKAKAEANKKAKAEEAKKKAAENKAKKKAKEEAKKEAKKNAEIKRLKAEAALPPEGKINKAGAFIVLLFFLLIGAFVIFGSGVLSYNSNIAAASEKFRKKEYNEAYRKIRGLDVKEKDMEIRDKIQTVMFVNKQLNSYNHFYAMGNYANALDSLIKGLFRYDKYIAYATQIGIKSDLNYVRKQIMSELENTYNMSERDALVLMGILDKKEYSENVYSIAGKVTKQKKPVEEEKEFVP